MPWELIFTAALQIVSWLLDRQKISKEAAEKFFEFVKKAGEDMGSVKLKEVGEKQLDWLKNNPWPSA